MDVLSPRRVMSNPSDQEHQGRSRHTGALRLAFRLPIYLYRLGLGNLLGHRFMLLTHGLLRRLLLPVGGDSEEGRIPGMEVHE
jgi:hypothetical protein